MLRVRLPVEYSPFDFFTRIGNQTEADDPHGKTGLESIRIGSRGNRSVQCNTDILLSQVLKNFKHEVKFIVHQFLPIFHNLIESNFLHYNLFWMLLLVI